METKLALLVFLFLTGCCPNPPKPSDSITEVPVITKAKISMPDKPNLSSSKLSTVSSDDETLKAALKDLDSYKTYSKQLEGLIKVQ